LLIQSLNNKKIIGETIKTIINDVYVWSVGDG